MKDKKDLRDRLVFFISIAMVVVTGIYFYTKPVPKPVPKHLTFIQRHFSKTEIRNTVMEGVNHLSVKDKNNMSKWSSIERSYLFYHVKKHLGEGLVDRVPPCATVEDLIEIIQERRKVSK